MRTARRPSLFTDMFTPFEKNKQKVARASQRQPDKWRVQSCKLLDFFAVDLKTKKLLLTSLVRISRYTTLIQRRNSNKHWLLYIDRHSLTSLGDVIENEQFALSDRCCAICQPHYRHCETLVIFRTHPGDTVYRVKNYIFFNFCYPANYMKMNDRNTYTQMLANINRAITTHCGSIAERDQAN